MKAIPTVMLNGGHFVVGACGSDMKVIPSCSLNGGRPVVGACMSATKAIPSCLLNGDRTVVDACGSDLVGAGVSDMNAIPSCLLNGDRAVVDACRSDMKTVPTDLRIPKSVLERRRFLADRFNWAANSLRILYAECAPLKLLDTHELKLSSCFSGLGTPEVCVEALVNAFRSNHSVGASVSSALAFDLCKASRTVLCADPCVGGVGADLLDLWPEDVRHRIVSGFDSLADLARYAKGQSHRLRAKFWCHRAGHRQELDLGHIHVAGSPCTDFSSMGKRRGFGGPTSAAFITCVILVRLHRPWIIIHENVLGFDI